MLRPAADSVSPVAMPLGSRARENTGAGRPYLGFGLGLRPEHYQEILDGEPAVDWFEVITDNYLVDGGKPLYFLDRIGERYPLVMHGVSMSLGSTDPIDWDYVERVRQLARRIDAPWFSDHLCWTGVDHRNLHDLMPLPYDDDTVRHVAGRIAAVQDRVGRPMLIENLSSYVTFRDSEMPEWEFLSRVAAGADCRILLDVNNIHVSAFNHGFDPREYIDAIEPERVWQIHLAGHLDAGDHIVDTHDHPVIEPVWDLYRYAIERFGAVSTMIERDADIPPLAEVVSELDRAREIARPLLAVAR